MKRTTEQGEITVAAIIAVTMTLLFVGALVFGFWAFAGKQDLQNNTNQKIDAAVEVAKKQTETAKDNEFAEASKSPVYTFRGSATFGSVSFDYPKTYSAYVVEKDTNSNPVDAYFHPSIVPDVNDSSVSFGLRYKIVSDPYVTVLSSFDSYVKAGKTTVAPFRAAKVPQTLGSRVEGNFTTSKSGTMLLIPLRDKTIEIWTESGEHKADFEKYVVPSISFVP